MPRQTTLVLLPGLDGTDVFFRPLLATLPGWVKPRVVCFPPTGSHEYAHLLDFVREEVSGLREFYVLGSSFSGPLALMLAAAEPAKVQGVVLAATFVRSPRPIYSRLRFAAVPPVAWAVRAGRRIPLWLTRGPNDQFLRDKTEAWRRASARSAAARAAALIDMDAREYLRTCPRPVLCIAGSRDRIVPKRNVEEIVRVRPSVSVHIIEGCHYAIYTNPTAAAEAITEFMSQRESGSHRPHSAKRQTPSSLLSSPL